MSANSTVTGRRSSSIGLGWDGDAGASPASCSATTGGATGAARSREASWRRIACSSSRSSALGSSPSSSLKSLPEGPIRLQCLGLPPGAVQRHQELSAQPLVERMQAHEGLELAERLCLAPQGEHGLEARLEGLQAQPFELGDPRLSEGLVRQIGEGRPAPDLERARERRLCIGERTCGGCCLALGDESLEDVCVETARLDLEEIAGGLGCERALVFGFLVEKLAQLRHVDLDAVRCRRRRVVAPESVDEPIPRDDAIALEQEQGEERTLLDPAEREQTSFLRHLQRPENSELDHQLPPWTTGQR